MFIRNKIKEYRQTLFVVLIFFIFLFLRLYRLGEHDFWADEAISFFYAKAPWELKLAEAPLYWILLYLWVKIFGFSEFILRFPSLIFSFLSVVLLFIFGKELFNKKIAIIAAMFMGLSPFHLWYAQEARNYSMILFLGILSNFLLWKALKERKNIFWLFFILTSLVGIYTHYFFLCLFFTQFFYLFIFKKMRINFKVTVCFLMVVLGFILHSLWFLKGLFFIKQGFWIPMPKWNSLIITLENFIFGYNGSGNLYFFSDILICLFFLLAFLAAFDWDLKESFAFCVFHLIVPFIFVFFFSRVFFPIYLDRYFIIFSPYLYLILSLGIAYLNSTIRAVLLVFLLAAFIISDYRYFKDWMVSPFEHHVGVYIKKPFKPVINFLKSKIGREDIIAVTSQSLNPVMRLYAQDKRRYRYYVFDPGVLDSALQRPKLEDRHFLPVFKIGGLEFNSLWVVSSNWARDGDLDDNSKSVKKWLDKNLKPQSVKIIEGVLISEYKKI